MKQIYTCIAGLLVFFSCTKSIHVADTLDRQPEMTPDYTGITLPANIAPLNFSLKETAEEATATLSYAGQTLETTLKGGRFSFPASRWKKLLSAARGNTVEVVVRVKKGGKWMEYRPVKWEIAEETIDPYIAYRLIAPGYTLWNRMGIYQRNLENFDESPIIENKTTDSNCMNCHSFCMQDPDKMLLHLREVHPGTLIANDGKVEKLQTKTEQTLSSLVYPSWHPSGKFVAFSVNNTQQGFHANNRNRIEVFDTASDVVVYDIARHEIVTTPSLFSKEAFETFPTFSPDGKRLYFCSAPSCPMPQAYDKVRYDLCAISFDPDSRRFGTVVDTLYKASEFRQSVSFPRVSPDGKWLMFTRSGYGNFTIWHKDADLCMVNLETGVCTVMDPLNSADVESYHSWSSNSRWVVFSSRRDDGLYTRPYIAYIDREGKARKPFLLPQADVSYYDRLMMSYNIPEFITGKVKVGRRTLSRTAKEEQGTEVRFVK